MQELAETPDVELVLAFARDRSESAFRALVERHAGWVYATAYRRLRDAHLAEDATQAVFVLLCQQAKQMKPQQIQKLSGWLFVTAGYVARSLLRTRRRAQRYESMAAGERPDFSSDAPPYAVDLDAAVARLSESDRDAILCRFYRGLEYSAIAIRLGISEEAARKRVSRAIVQLRRYLGAGASAEAIASASAFGAPSHGAALISSVTHTAMAAAGGSVPASLAPAMKGAIYLMTAAKIKVAAIVAVVLLIMATGAGVVAWQQLSAPSDVAPAPAISPGAVAAASPSPTFEELYALNGSVIRRVPPPFAKARSVFYHRQNANNPNDPDAILVYWENGKPFVWGSMFSRDRSGYQVQSLFEEILDFYPQETDGEVEVAQKIIRGDFVISTAVPISQRPPALAKVISESLNQPVALTVREISRPVIVFKGQWRLRDVDGSPVKPDDRNHSIDIYGSERGDPEYGGGGDGSVENFAKWLGRWIDKPVLFEATNLPESVRFHQPDESRLSQDGRRHAHDLDLVCNNIQRQTNLTWSREDRVIKVLFVERGK